MKSRNTKKIIGIAFAAALAFEGAFILNGVNTVVHADETEAVEEILLSGDLGEEEDASYDRDFSSTLVEESVEEEAPESIDEYSEEWLGIDLAEAIPARYVPDYENTFQKLRDQGSFGTCWAHASTFLMEINMIRQGKESKDDVNYSELALAYFVSHYVADPLKGTQGDFNRSDSVNGWLYGGGNLLYGARALAGWMGSTSETACPDTAYSNALNVYANGLDDKYAYDDAGHLDRFYRVNIQDYSAIKKLVMGNGGVGASFHAEGSVSTAVGKHYYSRENNCYFCDDVTTTNHAVVIVGWDDDFSKDNFDPEKRPENDGAWLIRNSWYYSDELPLDHLFGYFWLSYEDTSLGGSVMSFTDDYSDNYDHCYQYDGAVGAASVSSPNMVRGANIFTASAYDKGEKIEAVSFESASTNLEATAEIYLNPEPGDPLSGECVGRGTLNTSYAGYYTIELDEPAYIGSGETYSAVVTLKKRGFSPTISIESTLTGWFKSYPQALSGQSFIYDYEHEEWTDCAGAYGGNVRIKAFSSNVSPEEEYKTRLNKIIYHLDGGKNDEKNPQSFRWTSDTIYLSVPKSRTGYDFAGWYKDADYIVPIDCIEQGHIGDIDIYARWIPHVYRVKFNGNKNTSGAVTGRDYYSYGTTYYLPSNGFKKTGYSFDGWNTKADGSGKSYANQAAVKNLTSVDGQTVTLYAQWKANRYYINFKGNKSTSGTTVGRDYYLYNKSYTLPANAFKRKGYSFKCWNTKADGSGVDYTNKEVISNLTASNNRVITLYAQWKKNTYSIKYKLNGGTNNSKNPKKYTVTSSTFTLKNPKRKGYIFAGWYKDSAFTKKISRIEKGSAGNITLYAKWKPGKYTVIFDPNGAYASPVSKDFAIGQEETLRGITYTRRGYALTGWNTKKDGTGKHYNTNAVVKNLVDNNGGQIRLYAVWLKTN